MLSALFYTSDLGIFTCYVIFVPCDVECVFECYNSYSGVIMYHSILKYVKGWLGNEMLLIPERNPNETNAVVVLVAFRTRFIVSCLAI